MLKNKKLLDTGNFNRSLFIDSSNLNDIKKWNSTGVIDGVTTNQVIMLKDGITRKEYLKVIKEICTVMKGKPVSVELTDSNMDVKDMITEARKINNIAGNIIVKVPMISNTIKSLQVISALVSEDIAINVTVMMTFEQMIMAILATRHSEKPSFVSFFWGRSIEDHAKYRSRSDFMAKFPRVGMESEVNEKPHNIVTACSKFLKEGNFQYPKIIVGSIRTAAMVGEAYEAGGHIVTITPDTLEAMLFSQRSIETVKQFDDAWKKISF